MDANIRRRLSMAQRALDFANAHPVNDTSFAVVVKRLQDAVTQADTAGMQQQDSTAGERAAVTRRKGLRRRIVEQQLRRLAGVAALAAAEHPELAGALQAPSARVPNKAFLLAAQSMLAAATPQQTLLVSLGLGEHFIDTLTQALGEYQAATESAHAGRAGHVGARADMAAMAANCQREVVLLDTFYQEASTDDAELLAGWKSARNVNGPYRHRNAAPTPAPVPAPVTPPAEGDQKAA